ncbi:hypothetical protein, partial [Corynebacterium diphtheriae]|uniref:hypothetical protein n=1 Tax=Corynebacterium diphtheriae TaxID=1717 RepID=UPI001A7E0FD9
CVDLALFSPVLLYGGRSGLCASVPGAASSWSRQLADQFGDSGFSISLALISVEPCSGHDLSSVTR